MAITRPEIIFGSFKSFISERRVVEFDLVLLQSEQKGNLTKKRSDVSRNSTVFCWAVTSKRGYFLFFSFHSSKTVQFSCCFSKILNPSLLKDNLKIRHCLVMIT